MLEHPEAERADPYEKDVERVWRDSGKVYGARKIRHALGHEGVTLSRRRVNRIMKGNGMAGSCSKAAYRPRPARPDDDPAPDILAREFNGYAPRTHLASDPAYVRVGSVLLQCLFDRFGSVFPQCGLMVFPGVVIVSR